MLAIRKRYECQSCYALWMVEEAADRCCPAEEVYLCGKRKRGAYGTTDACRHWSKEEARSCQRTDRRRKQASN